jgi:hypothetical protein
VCELVAILRLPQYQISRHLGQLRRSGVLVGERRGPFVFYGLADAVRRHPVYASVLRLLPKLGAGGVGSEDLGRMQRLMRLDPAQRVTSCAASAAQSVRRRPILRALPTGARAAVMR